MYKVGDGVEAVRDFKYMGIRVGMGEVGIVAGVLETAPGIAGVDFSLGRVLAYTESHAHPEVRLLPEPEFDQGGLKRMPDGTLESVDIPGPEAEREPIPYTATGTGSKPAPKLEWRVDFSPSDPRYEIRLIVDGEEWPGFWAVGVPHSSQMTNRKWRRVQKEMARKKKIALEEYMLTVRESGLV